ncbi:MAG: SufD family Fe-S cluster assembly protein, partial [Gemmatimonadota bacterium]
MNAPADEGLRPVAERLDEWLDELDEPDFLLEERRRAWERYRELPMPQTASEEWRYTDVEDLRPESFGFLEPAATRSVEVEELPATVQEVLAGDQPRSGVAVQVDAGEVYRRLDEELEEKGVVFAPVAEIARERPELLEDRLFSSEVTDAEEKFWTLHKAILSGGWVLYVPENVRVPEPVHVFRYLEREDAVVGSHTLVVAERGAEVTCVEEFLSPDLEETSLSVGGVEVFAGENATVRYISLQRYGRGVEHYSVQHATTRKDSQLSGFNVALGADRHRAD